MQSPQRQSIKSIEDAEYIIRKLRDDLEELSQKIAELETRIQVLEP